MPTKLSATPLFWILAGGIVILIIVIIGILFAAPDQFLEFIGANDEEITFEPASATVGAFAYSAAATLYGTGPVEGAAILDTAEAEATTAFLIVLFLVGILGIILLYFAISKPGSLMKPKKVPPSPMMPGMMGQPGMMPGMMGGPMGQPGMMPGMMGQPGMPMGSLWQCSPMQKQQFQQPVMPAKTP